MLRETRSPALAVCGVDFGWGSAGKIRTIIDNCLSSLPDLRVVMLGTVLGRTVLKGVPIEAWYERWPAESEQLGRLFAQHGVRAGLVVLDPHAATACEAAGCPTVYVDSLPYLWTPVDPLPTEVSVYCAQRCESLPPASQQALSAVRNLRWIDGVVSAQAPRRRRARLAVLNLGGLHSPTATVGNPGYLRLVVPAALQALKAAGFQRVQVTGNVGPADLGGDRKSAGCNCG